MRISDWSSDVCSSDLTIWLPVDALSGTCSLATARASGLIVRLQRSSRGRNSNKLQLNSCSSAPLDGFVSSSPSMFPTARPKASTIITFDAVNRSEEHTSELQSLMRISYAVFCLKKKTKNNNIQTI